MKKIITAILMCAALMLTTACSSNGESAVFSHGTRDGNVYTSEFLGFKAELEESWSFTDDSGLAQSNGIDSMSDDNTAKALKTNGMLYEMIAAAGDSSSNMNITIENLNVTNLGRELTAEQYIDAAFNNIKNQYAAAGINDVEAEKSAVNFLGSETACIKTTLKADDTELRQMMIPVSKGKYMGVIALTASDEEGLNTQLEMFKSL